MHEDGWRKREFRMPYSPEVSDELEGLAFMSMIAAIQRQGQLDLFQVHVLYIGYNGETGQYVAVARGWARENS